MHPGQALDEEVFGILNASVQRFVAERLVPAEDEVELHDEVPPAILADRQAEMLAGWALVQASAWHYDAKAPGAVDPVVSKQAACTRMFTTEMVARVAARGGQIHGGAGYINDYRIERFYRDVRLLRLYEGTTQIQQLVIGRHLMREA